MSFLQANFARSALLCALLCSTPALAQPVIALPTEVSVTVATGSSKSSSFAVGNTGTAPLNYSISLQGTLPFVDVGAAAPDLVGYATSIYTQPPASLAFTAQFAADDFVVPSPLPVVSL
ncbi:MAG: hypothetical protein ACRDAM_02420, partial [Casimicrobium sp.]